MWSIKQKNHINGSFTKDAIGLLSPGSHPA